MNYHFDYPLERNEEEFILEVTGRYYKGYAGSYYDPPEYPEFELISVKHGTAEFELTDGEEQELCDYALENVVDGEQW